MKFFTAFKAIIKRILHCFYRCAVCIRGCFLGIGYREFGLTSRIVHPMRVLGKKYISIGKNVQILNGLRMEAVSRYGDQVFVPGLKIGDGTSIGQNCHIISAENLIIGENVTFSGNIFVSDCLHEYQEFNKHILSQPLTIRHTEIGDYSFVGYGAAILPGSVLGKQCIVGANAVVTAGTYPDGSVLAGVPARIIRCYNVETKHWERVKDNGYKTS